MNLLFLLLWAVVSAGTAKLLAMAENVLHGLGWPRPVLQRVRLVHNLLLFSYPLLVMLLIGIAEPTWLTSPTWRPLASWQQFLIAVGLAGFLLLLTSTIRHLTYRPPACETASHSKIVDVRQIATEPLIGPGRAQWLARLPGNQQFTLEVHERTYFLPRLPPTWDGLTIVHFSDCHFRGPVALPYFQHVMQEVQKLQGDIVAFTGDLLDHRNCLEWIPQTLGAITAPLGCYFILGNHDWYLKIDDRIRQALADCGWQDVASRVTALERGGQPLVICGSERPWMGTAPDLSAVAPSAFRLLLSHSPDRITWARQQGIDLMLAGHTHGGQIRLPIIGPVYAPSVHSCRYASGVFWLPPTLMSVTRGVSGREPIRYNCRPEIIRLTLRSQPK